MIWMFWGHLKAEDFVNLMEGSVLAPRHQAHLSACARCAETLQSVQSLRARMADSPSEDEADETLEPDWDEFRSGVRGALLSRSVRRERLRQTWFGEIAWKPALAWGLSLVFVIGVTSELVQRSRSTPEDRPAAVIDESASDGIPIDVETVASMGRPDVFDELLRLSADEAATLERLLREDLSGNGASPQ